MTRNCFDALYYKNELTLRMIKLIFNALCSKKIDILVFIQIRKSKLMTYCDSSSSFPISFLKVKKSKKKFLISFIVHLLQNYVKKTVI